MLRQLCQGVTVSNAVCHFGRWQDTLADVTCDALIFDAPYSSRTHASTTTRSDGTDPGGLTPEYLAFGPAEIREVCESWSERTRGWIVSVTDSVLAPVWEAELARVGRYAFAPVGILIPGMTVRVQGDGPSSWMLYALVARPRTLAFSTWGTLPGGYTGGTEGNGRAGGSSRGGGRGKPIWLLSALVRDYSRTGDLVCDPFAGYGSTLTAALSLGRRAIGAEMDAQAHAECVRRLKRPLQIDMFATTPPGAP